MNVYLMCSLCGADIEVPTGKSETGLLCRFCHARIHLPASRFQPGDVLAGYRIHERIEAHGCRETYLAEKAADPQKFRLQTFSSPLFESGISADYFLAAMKRWMRVKQPNVTPVLDAGRTSGGVYFAAHAPVEGMTLEDRLWRGGGMALKPAIHLAISISRILEWLWNEHGIIYGGLTPRHIILKPDQSVLLMHMTLAPILRERPAALPLHELATGMPGFISPEQFSSPDSMDFRSDFYSLGATLYHMTTGKTPFSCLSTSMIRERHQAPTLADPRTLCPDLPDEFVWFLEVLLAHDPADRFDSWSSLMEVITHLERGQAVAPAKAMKSHSVLIRMSPQDLPKRTVKTPALKRLPLPPAERKTQPGARNYTGIIVGTCLVIGAVLAMFFALLSEPPASPRKAELPFSQGGIIPVSRAHSLPSQASREQPPPPTDTSAHFPETQAESAFLTLYNDARQCARQEPVNYEDVLQRYAALTKLAQANHPRWLERLQEEAHDVQLAMSGPLDDAQQTIRDRTRLFDESAQYQQGISWLLHYSGPFAKTTTPLRQELADALKQKSEASLRAAAVDITVAADYSASQSELVATLCSKILAHDFYAARQRLNAARADRKTTWTDAQIDGVKREVSVLEALPAQLADCFRSGIGKTIDLQLTTGPLKGRLESVDNRQLKVQVQTSENTPTLIVVPLSTLSARDIFRILDTAPKSSRALLKGYVAWQGGEPPLAATAFRSASHSLLASALALHVARTMDDNAEEQAQTSLSKLLALAGVNAGTNTLSQISESIDRRAYSWSEASQIKNAARTFLAVCGKTAVARESAPIISALKSAAVTPRKVTQETLDAAMSGVESANKRDLEFRLLSRLDNGSVILESLGGKLVPDLSNLKRLPIAQFSFRNSKLTRLPVLTELSIRRLDLSDSSITDISNIRNVPVEELYLDRTGVRDLKPLKEVPTLRCLSAQNCLSLTNITPLAGTPLRELDLSGTQVADLSPLKGSPLEILTLANAARIRDLTPLSQVEHLHVLTLPSANINATPLRILTELKEIGYPTPVSAAEFWKE